MDPKRLAFLMAVDQKAGNRYLNPTSSDMAIRATAHVFQHSQQNTAAGCPGCPHPAPGVWCAAKRQVCRKHGR